MFQLILFNQNGDACHWPTLFKIGEDADFTACQLTDYDTWSVVEVTYE